MATWKDLRAYIHDNYKVSDDNGDFIRMLFRANGDRSQFVYVSYTPDKGGTDWIQVESPIGKLGEVNVVSLLRQVEKIVCGGLALVGEMVTLRHAVPLDDMSVEEFEGPLEAIYASADRMESTVSLQDKY